MGTRPGSKAPAGSPAPHGSTDPAGVSRRGFVAATAAAGAMVSIARGANVAGSDRLKVGLVGCGGRGTSSGVPARPPCGSGTRAKCNWLD